ncbi:MAG: hypothetical protein H5T49_04085 [Hadesarchaea archaeon]|nr:hypothetical protein [Hadesarchaea archaeon]
MQVVGYDEMGRAIISVPSGLEKLDFEEILRHRHLGVFGDAPSEHFLGGSYDITFGDGGKIGACWKRMIARENPRETRLWRNAYREIGTISSWLGLPNYVRDEITRIYANLRTQGITVKAGITLEKQLAKITWLACLIHRLPRTKEEINRGLKELYGFGIGKIPRNFIKAANYKNIRFRYKKENGRLYLRRYELDNTGRMYVETVLGLL